MRKLIFICLIALAAPSFAFDLAPSKTDKCPYCGMFVYKYPDWITGTIMTDGTIYYYDGAKDMFNHYFSMPASERGQVSEMTVSEYYDLEHIEAHEAFYVIGSDVYGPMGNELIPLKSEEDAKGFMADHKGRAVLRFDEVTPELLKGLR